LAVVREHFWGAFLESKAAKRAITALNEEASPLISNAQVTIW